MSVEVMARVWKLDLIASDKLIVLAFADHADDSGFCYPSLHRIAWKCGVSKDTVRRCLARMACKGILQVLSRGDGRGHTTRYRVNPDKGSTLQPFIPKGLQIEDKGLQMDMERVAPETVKGSIAVLPESSLEPSVEPSLETPKKKLAFEFFWESYPRKVGKPAAARAWREAERLVDLPVIMQRLEWWKESDEWRIPKFIPHPSTFLNQHRWNDAPLPRRKTEAESGTGPLEREPSICGFCGATKSWHMNAEKRGNKPDHAFGCAPKATG